MKLCTFGCRMLWNDLLYAFLGRLQFDAVKQCVVIPVIPTGAKAIIGKLLKFAVYIHHYKSLPRSILGPIMKNKMAVMDVSLTVIREFYTL